MSTERLFGIQESANVNFKDFLLRRRISSLSLSEANPLVRREDSTPRFFVPPSEDSGASGTSTSLMFSSSFTGSTVSGDANGSRGMMVRLPTTRRRPVTGSAFCKVLRTSSSRAACQFSWRCFHRHRYHRRLADLYIELTRNRSRNRKSV